MTSAIQPVTVFPDTANRIEIDPSFAYTVGGTDGPRLNYRLQKVANDGTVTNLADDTVYMTAAQWNAWATSANDVNYIISCALTNLGLTAA